MGACHYREFYIYNKMDDYQEERDYKKIIEYDELREKCRELVENLYGIKNEDVNLNDKISKYKIMFKELNDERVVLLKKISEKMYENYGIISNSDIGILNNIKNNLKINKNLENILNEYYNIKKDNRELEDEVNLLIAKRYDGNNDYLIDCLSENINGRLNYIKFEKYCKDLLKKDFDDLSKLYHNVEGTIKNYVYYERQLISVLRTIGRFMNDRNKNLHNYVENIQKIGNSNEAEIERIVNNRR